MSEPTEKSLTEKLRERIRSEGSITFHDWMRAALYDERAGYYCRRDRIRQGRAGDYRTAPERSPLFGGTFARYFMKSYFDLGAPEQWTIVDVGSGAGDFAREVLNGLRRNFPKIFAATRYVIDEVSAGAQSQILTNIAEFKDRVRFHRLEEMDKPLTCVIIFSNELVDAFPVHRVIGCNGKLKELSVGLSNSNEFIWIETKLSAPVAEYCERIELRLAEGQIYEINLAAEDFVRRASSLIESGLLITVDYGAERNDLIQDPNRFKGTLRTFRRHQLGDDVLSHPGEQDLTTTVDWTQMIEAGERNGLETLRLERLDQFLFSQGAVEEMQTAAATISDQADLFNFNAGARELILPTGMAASFQVLVQRKGS